MVKNRFWTSEQAALGIDGLITVLLSMGFIQPLFYNRALDVSWLATLATCLLATTLTVLLSRRWWLVPAVVLFVGLPGAWILERLKLLPVWVRAITDFFTWSGQRLLLGGPEPESDLWLTLLRFSLVLLVSLPVFALVRKTGRLWIFLILALLVDIPFLFAHPSAISQVLPTLAGLITLLPVSLVRTVKKRHPQAVLPRAPLQWLALPVALLSVLAGQFITPDDTSRWRQQDWVNRLYDIRDFWQNQSGSARGWQSFDLAVAGFRSAETRLGGPVRPYERTFLEVISPESVLLRGVTRTLYTGSRWQSPPHQVYRLGSPLWRLTRRQVFTEDLPAGADGRQFLNEYAQTININISPKSRLQTTIFAADRFRSLSWGNTRDYPPYFTVDGDLFVFNGLPGNPDYSITVTLFMRNRQGFSEAISRLAESPLRTRDPYWTAIKDRYLQLPGDLPAIVGDTARQVTASADDPYGQAVLLEDFFRQSFNYALDADFPPEGMDFIEHLLQEERGYCVHFATAMTVMARTLGLPSRYVEGFALDRVDDQDDTWLATGRTAHAWSEIYFQGIGWLTFDPTPADRTVPEPEPEPTRPASQPSPILLEPTPDPGLFPTDPIDLEPETTGYGWLIALFGVLLLAIVIRLLILTLVRNHLRTLRLTVMRRLQPDPALCLEAAYQDILQQLSCLDIHPETGETLSAFSERADHYLRFENMKLPELLWPVICWRYGGHPPATAELDALLQFRMRLEDRLRESMTRTAWFWHRVVAAWYQASKKKKS